jgi:hypothetical protein
MPHRSDYFWIILHSQLQYLYYAQTNENRHVGKVKSFGGETLERVIVEISGDTVYICTKEEWRDAMANQREPECVGFNRRYVCEEVVGCTT